MRRHLCAAGLASLSIAVALSFCPALPAQDDAAAPAGIEVLARGPVHEAYAEPAQVRPEPSPVVPRQPPAPVEEMPPEQKPEGENVVWIPGYWAWDNDRNDFLWVSGIWRDAPPDRYWVPGTWQKVESGWQWTPGFWSDARQEEFQYLPTPPPSVEEGPATPIPDEDSTYVPGCWVWRETRYLWRPGFWHRFHPGWVWIAAHYIWTPAGCVFVEGYWDFPLEQRGLLFAPVAVERRFLAERTVFVPTQVVQPDFLLTALFVRPATCHYYFGDYFTEDYQRAGFIPWVNYRINRVCYDPNFAYYRHAIASREWESNLRALYTARFEGTVPRPPQTLVQQTEIVRNLTIDRSTNVTVNKNINITNIQNTAVLAPLNRIHNVQVTNLAALGNRRPTELRSPQHVFRMQEVPHEQRLSEQRSAARFHEAAQQRQQVENRVLRTAPPARREGPPPAVRLNVPHPAAHPPARPAEVHPQPHPPAAGRPQQPATKPAPRPPAPEPRPAAPRPAAPRPPAPEHHQAPPMPPAHHAPPPPPRPPAPHPAPKPPPHHEDPKPPAPPHK
jgi:hypothetical protein